jgi:hypothetical protein
MCCGWHKGNQQGFHYSTALYQKLTNHQHLQELIVRDVFWPFLL